MITIQFQSTYIYFIFALSLLLETLYVRRALFHNRYLIFDKTVRYAATFISRRRNQKEKNPLLFCSSYITCKSIILNDLSTKYSCSCIFVRRRFREKACDMLQLDKVKFHNLKMMSVVIKKWETPIWSQ
jgi:hypothetical protein